MNRKLEQLGVEPVEVTREAPVVRLRLTPRQIIALGDLDDVVARVRLARSVQLRD